MTLHLIEDSVISDRIINNFNEVLPGKNIFLCFIGNNSKYVKKRDSVLFYKTRYPSLDRKLIEVDLDCLVIHYLSHPKIDFINKYIDKSIPIYWIMWGGDCYNNLLTYYGHNIYYEPYYVGGRYCILYHLSKFLNLFSLRIGIGFKILNFIRERVNYYVSDVDYNLLRTTFPQYVKGEQIKGFFYYPIDSIVGKELMNPSNRKNTILIGNSASISNNHSYGFKYLKNLDIGTKKVVVPLSYGGTIKYKKHIINEGGKIWGQRFCPILNFLPLEDYNKILADASICIYSNWRQEAMGNMLGVLGLGSKVFLSEKNPLYSYLCQLGFIIYSLENISQEQIDSPLPLSDIEHNQRVILDNYNKKALDKAIIDIWG